jgi:DNA-binding transcriptional MerR regulator/effector-binding domain-containing protein
MVDVSGYLSIGDFSRATHMTIKTLRHYHEIGLLTPAEVDPGSGYRRYGADQIPVAQVIHRFRDLGMPLEEIQSVLSAPDLRTRNERITTHLDRLEAELGRTRSAIASLRDLLTPSVTAPVSLRSVPSVNCAAVTDVVDGADSVAWGAGALGELHATLAAQGISPTGCPGGIFDDDVFTEHHGRMTIYLPCTGQVRPTGRVTPMVIPSAELAIIEHPGPYQNVDLTYGTLADYVARHAIAVEGPIREYYVVSQLDTADTSRWRTEIGWPVFAVLSGPLRQCVPERGGVELDPGDAERSEDLAERVLGHLGERLTRPACCRQRACRAERDPRALPLGGVRDRQRVHPVGGAAHRHVQEVMMMHVHYFVNPFTSEPEMRLRLDSAPAGFPNATLTATRRPLTPGVRAPAARPRRRPFPAPIRPQIRPPRSLTGHTNHPPRQCEGCSYPGVRTSFALSEPARYIPISRSLERGRRDQTGSGRRELVKLLNCLVNHET